MAVIQIDNETWEVNLATHKRIERIICKEEERIMTLISNLKLSIGKRTVIQRAIGEFGDLLTDTDIRFAEVKSG